MMLNQNQKKMFNQDEGKLECPVGSRERYDGARKPRLFLSISDFGIHGIYLSLALGTAKLEH